jgi:GTP cyclohydrolase II
MSRPAPNECEFQERHDDVARIRTWVDLPMGSAGDSIPARLFTFRGLSDPSEHVALGLGPFRRPRGGVPLVRVHSECLTGEVFRSRRCDCGPQLDEAIGLIAGHGGYVLYLRQEGRGIGLYAKVDAYRLQNQGLDTYQANRALGFNADDREYSVAAQMLQALGVHRIDLLTGNPVKAEQLSGSGIELRDVRSTRLHETAENVRYLETKRNAGHSFLISSAEDRPPLAMT